MPVCSGPHSLAIDKMNLRQKMQLPVFILSGTSQIAFHCQACGDLRGTWPDTSSTLRIYPLVTKVYRNPAYL